MKKRIMKVKDIIVFYRKETGGKIEKLLITYEGYFEATKIDKAIFKAIGEVATAWY